MHTIRARWLGLVAPLLVAAAMPAAGQCAGDCNGDARVDVAELTRGVRMVLEGPEGFACAPAFDVDADGFVTVGEVIGAVAHAVLTCPQCPPLTRAYDAPCRLTVTLSCAGAPDRMLAGLAVRSDGEQVSLDLLDVQPPLRFTGQVRDALQADIGSVVVGPDRTPADALLELSASYTDGRQTYRLFLHSPTLVIDQCQIEQFFGAFAVP